MAEDSARTKRARGATKAARLDDILGDFLIRVDIRDVKEGKRPVREIHEDDVVMKQLEDAFVRNRYGESGQFISVTVYDMDAEFIGEFRSAVEGTQIEWEGSTMEYLKTNNAALYAKMEGLEMEYVDGMHRGSILKSMQ